MVKKRKKRSDRNHILYQLTLKATGERYIGVSGVIGAAIKGTLNERFRRHKSRATHEEKTWTLHERLRAYPDPTQWDRIVLQVVRGRAEAFERERELINMMKPELNSF